MLVCAPNGVSRTLAAYWGGSRPPAIKLTTGPILDPKTAFDSPVHELTENIAKFHLKATDDVAGYVKGQILDSAIASFAGQSTHINLK